MKARSKSWKCILLTIICIVCTLVFIGCSTNGTKQASTSQEGHYTKISNIDGFDFYVNDSIVQVDDEHQADAKRLVDAVENYVLNVLYSSYNGHVAVVDGDSIGAPGLEQEMDARIAYIAEKYGEKDFSSMAPYLRFDTFNIQDDAAKIIVSFRMQDPNSGKVMAENHEGYIFKKSGRNWLLVNNIVDTGHGGNDVLRKLAKDKDPESWKTSYAYDQLKRSDYENAHDYSYLIDEERSTVTSEK